MDGGIKMTLDVGKSTATAVGHVWVFLPSRLSEDQETSVSACGSAYGGQVSRVLDMQDVFKLAVRFDSSGDLHIRWSH